MVHLPFPVLLLPELWAVGVAVLTLVARVALDCVRSSLVSAPLAENDISWSHNVGVSECGIFIIIVNILFSIF